MCLLAPESICTPGELVVQTGRKYSPPCREVAAKAWFFHSVFYTKVIPVKDSVTAAALLPALLGARAVSQHPPHLPLEQMMQDFSSTDE